MLAVIGFNHQSTPVAVRERLAFDAGELNANSTDYFKQLQQQAKVSSIVILSTCNRTELYIYCLDDGSQQLICQWLSTIKNISVDILNQHHYYYSFDEAVKHLFSVISGIDSMVMGETQIAGQLKFAYQVSQGANILSADMDKLFQYAFKVGKQIRTQSALGESPVSIASIAVKLANRIFSQFADKKIVLIGAGETIELAATHFQNRIDLDKANNSQKQFIIANRTLSKAVELADKFNAIPIQLMELSDHLHQADIVISSTASQLPILGKGMVERVMKQRKHKIQLIIDLAVPRDVESEVNDIENVYLYSIDDLQSVANENLQQREQAANHGKKLIAEALEQWHLENKSRVNLDIIRTFREQSFIVRDEAVEKATKRLLSGEDPEAVINLLATQLTNKMIHNPTQGLKQLQQDDNGESTQQKLAWSKQLLGI